MKSGMVTLESTLLVTLGLQIVEGEMKKKNKKLKEKHQKKITESCQRCLSADLQDPHS